jgi:3-hydroxymyristoyl/3-hydroxydecanoyl-(acyl carrier protein) dehydratase
VSAPALPLIAARDLEAPIAWRDGAPVSARRFLAGAAALAERIAEPIAAPITAPIAGQVPGAARPINLCEDRLHFALALAAALMRGQTSLMPPNAMPATLERLPAGPGPAYALADRADLDAAGLPVVPVSLAEAPAAADPAMPLIDPALEAVCLLTSGSTGAPQPHAKRFGPLVLNIAAEAARLAEHLERPSLAGLTIVATVPPQHSYGLESSVLLALLGGAAFDTGRPFYPADIAAALARLPRPRALVTTPFHLKALLGARIALPPVDLVLSATAPLSPQLAAAAEAAMRARLVEIYGCTEAGQVASRRTTAGQTWTTLGELRLAREAGAEGVDRFIVQGGHVTEPTPLADVLELHDARHFELLGRANDLIHVAGKRSSLAHLNFHLNRIEGVRDGAFWLPEASDLNALGEPGATEAVIRTLAFVVAPGLAARDIVAALRREVESAFLPRRVIHVDALPREATGKLTAGALREFALQWLGRPKAAQAEPQTPADEYTIEADHPAFAGHFPGRPLLPGVVLLSLVMRSLEGRSALRARLGPAPVIEQVKFLAPVGPGARVRVELAGAARAVAFECTVGARCVARGRLASAAAAAGEPA